MSFTADLQEIVNKNENGLLGAHESWGRVKLGDVVSILNGYPFDSRYFGKVTGNPLLRIRDILRQDTETKYLGPVPEGYWIYNGDLVVGMDGDFNCTLWQGGPVLLNQRVCKITVNVKYLDKSFLRHALGGYLAAINSNTSSITVKHLSSKTIADIPLAFPPLPEQKRIADKLSALLARVESCHDRLDRVPGILKRFQQGVLAVATSGELTREWREERGEGSELQSFQLEDAGAIRDYHFPASWNTGRLSDIAAIATGVTKDSKKQIVEYIELPYLRVANVQRGYLDLNEVKTIRVPPGRVADLLLKAGDILFNEGGDIDKLGRGWVWSDELPACVLQNHVFRARLFDSSFEPRYFSWYGNSRGYEYFLSHGKQTTNLASINKSVLANLPVAVPSADEQAEIARRVQGLLQIIERLEKDSAAAAAQIMTLTTSILATAFRGELVPQDPSDVPAAELLAKLKAEILIKIDDLQGSRSKASREKVMSITVKERVRIAISKLRDNHFSFDEVRSQVASDYESLKDALFELLEEEAPIVRQVFDIKKKAMRLERVDL